MFEAAADLVEALGSLPFVDLPQPEEVGALRRGVREFLAGLEQLSADVRQFQEETAAEIAAVADTAAQVNSRLQTTQDNLAAADSELAALQAGANEFREQFPLWATVTAVLLNLFLIWVAYGMVHLIRAYWAEWQVYRSIRSQATATEQKTVADPGSGENVPD
jgi:hypothetical protein